jgi:hypothetical protein
MFFSNSSSTPGGEGVLFSQVFSFIETVTASDAVVPEGFCCPLHFHFQFHPLLLINLVPNLMSFYADFQIGLQVPLML